MPKAESNLILTVMVTVVSGSEAMRENLAALCRQVDPEKMEIIVPYDKWSSDIGSLVPEFPDVTFRFIDDLGMAESAGVSSHKHRLYDRRRAIGLGLSRGEIIAMTEDHAQPADDWVQQILKAHEQAFDVIGGAVENGVDKPMNRALYYCDFGRYGRPFNPGEAAYLSDVNLSYKRDALMSVRDIWQDAYHETTVHWALLARGKKLFLDDRLAVYQKRPKLSLSKAFKERIEWGRVFAETRANEITPLRRWLFAAGTPLLPLLMSARVFGHMRRQSQRFGKMITTLPLAFVLLIGWAMGELLGYISGAPMKNNVSDSEPKSAGFFDGGIAELRNTAEK